MIEQGKIKGLKFGDVVVNHHASNRNPHRLGVFIRFIGGMIELTDTAGNFWTVINDGESKFERVGTIFDSEDSING